MLVFGDVDMITHLAKQDNLAPLLELTNYLYEKKRWSHVYTPCMAVCQHGVLVSRAGHIRRCNILLNSKVLFGPAFKNFVRVLLGKSSSK